MNARLIGWRKKPTERIEELIEEVVTKRLYLVNRIGPTIFQFRDDDDQKFKVEMGNVLKCTCSPGLKDHCIHTIYVVIKVFRVEIGNPLVWQGSYTDSQLQNMAQLKYQKIDKVKRQLKIKLPKQTQKESEEDVGGKKIQADSCCPICQDQLIGQATSYCRACGNHFHCNCLRVWLKHKSNSGDDITCPMCRHHMQNIKSNIQHDTQKFEQQVMIHKQKCQSCGQVKIRGWMFKCIHCQSANFCKNCMQLKAHEHAHYLLKCTSTSQWQQYSINPYQSEFKEQPQKGVHEYLIESFPKLDDLLKNDTSLLCVTGNQKSKGKACSNCKKVVQSSNLRVARCNHQLCQECLRHIISHTYCCPIDGSTVLPGYMQAMRIKPNTQIEFKRKESRQFRQPVRLNSKAKPSIGKPKEVRKGQLPTLGIFQGLMIKGFQK